MPSVIYGPNQKLAARNTPGWARVQQEMGADADHFDQLLHARAGVIAADDSPSVWGYRTPQTWEVARVMEILIEIYGLTPEQAATELRRAIHEQGQTDKFGAEAPETAAALQEMATERGNEAHELSDKCWVCEIVEEQVSKTTIPASFSTKEQWFNFAFDTEWAVVTRMLARMTERFTAAGVNIFEHIHHCDEDEIREKVAEFYEVPFLVLNAVLEKVNCTAFRKQLEDLEIIEKSAEAATA